MDTSLTWPSSVSHPRIKSSISFVETLVNPAPLNWVTMSW
jgi:hypothetical protein